MKTENKKTSAALLKAICLLLSGMGVGWLIGLSISPVVHIVIASLIAFIVSVTSALAGIKLEGKEDQTSLKDAPNSKFHVEVNPFPLMFAVVGIAIGASLGVYARTANWLGPNPGRFAEQWKDTELSKKEISRRLFDELYPPRSRTDASAAASTAPEIGGQKPSEPGTEKAAAGAENNNSSAAVNPEPGGPTSPALAKADSSKSETFISSEAAKSNLGVLFTASSKECDRFRAARDEGLKDELLTAGDSRIRQAAERCPDLGCLKGLVEKTCPKSR